MADPQRIQPERTVLTVIDMQAKLLPYIDAHLAVTDAVNLLIRGCGVFDVPLLATEQYPQGIGPTVDEVASTILAAGGRIREKMPFSCFGDGGFRENLRTQGRSQVVVCGIEAHVCVQQTCLDLNAHGYQVFVCADAIGSRAEIDYHMALQRMRDAGVIVTTVESVLFEMCGECGTTSFKEMIGLIKLPREPDTRF